MRRLIVWLITHGVALAIGFALGIYMLPILIAPDSPSVEMLSEKAENALFVAEFTRELDGSDFLHWGEGKVSVTATEIIHEGSLAPGPDYKLYLVPEFVEDEAGFNAIKANAIQIGEVKTFKGFLLDVPPGANINNYNTVLVWCETFGEFITAAKYR